MREIKFRVWDTKKEAFVNGGLRINISDSPDEIKVSEITEVSCAESHVILQYTGFKDRNGIEIYEGDILYDWECDRIFRIESLFYFYNTFKDTIKYDLGFAPYRVIGNIYEGENIC